MLRTLSVPAENQRGPQYMDLALAAIHQANGRRLQVTLEIARMNGQVSLACRFPDELRPVIEGQLYAQYPECRILPVNPPKSGEQEPQSWELDLHLRHDLFPIKRYSQFEDALNRVNADPLTALLTTLATDPSAPSLQGTISIMVRPVRRSVRRRAQRCLRRLAGPFFHRHHRLGRLYGDLALSSRWPVRVVGWLVGRLERQPGDAKHLLTTTATRVHDREEELQAAADKIGRLLFETTIRLRVTGPAGEERRARGKLREMAGAFGQFSSPRMASFRASRKSAHGFLLSTEELATLWHPATATVRAATMATVESREAEPPVQLPTPRQHPDLAVLGMATFRSRDQVCGVLPDDRRRHVYIAGKTGMGKSTLLHRLLSSDIAAGRGVALIDPHGDLCDAVLASVQSQRTNDVVLFDAGDAGFPISFNIFACANPSQRPLVASGIVAAFKKMYGEFWGPRMEHILRNAVLALLEVRGTSLLSLLRLLSEGPYRDAIVSQVSDPLVRAFWLREFGRWPKKLQAEAVGPVQNKIGHFLSNPLLRNIIGQSRSTLDLRSVMDEGKVLLVNLSKGRIGEDASTLLGSFLVTAVQLAAMGRADMPEEKRRDFYLYVDEFQNYATESFATILSEARKYRLNLTVANQYLAQVEEQTLAAVFGNIGTLVAFQVGAQDAEPIAEQLAGEVTPKDLLTLPRFHAYIRLLINGHPSRPFSLHTLPPPRMLNAERPHIIRRTSRHRYARPVSQVHGEIEKIFATV